MSNLSIGYHPHLLLNYEQNKNTFHIHFLTNNQKKLINFLIYKHK